MKRTDLAMEAAQLSAPLEGVESCEVKQGEITVTRVKIWKDEAAQTIGKPRGTYVTVEMHPKAGEETAVYDRAASIVAEELGAMARLDAEAAVLAAGLGNQYITSDSIGPKTVANLLVTRHLKELAPEEMRDMRTVSAIAPGVLGLTGIETGEIVHGLVEKVHPSLVIAIDALATRSMNRVGTTIQLSDTGINPGSGVGNNRKELSRATLGVPVVAIGVPMVVDAATIADDAIDMVIHTMQQHAGDKLMTLLGDLQEEERYTLIRESLGETENMVVTPKEVDALAERVSAIIATGINLALQNRISPEEVQQLAEY